MWRFILVTFVFLGWSFYVLSGGAGYVPGENSIQAQAKLDAVRPVARPETIRIASLEPAEPAESTSRAITSLADLPVIEDDSIQVTLASISTAQAPDAARAADPAKVEALTGAAESETAEAVEAALALSLTEESEETADIRIVTGILVNMRGGPGTKFEKIAQLPKGTEVEVLQEPGNAWVQVKVAETGDVGWMAGWLVTASAN